MNKRVEEMAERLHRMGEEEGNNRAAEEEAVKRDAAAAAAALHGFGHQGGNGRQDQAGGFRVSTTPNVGDSNTSVNYGTRPPQKMPNNSTQINNRLDLALRNFAGIGELTARPFYRYPHTGPVHVMSCRDHSFLGSNHGVQTVRVHLQVWRYLLKSTSSTDAEEKLAACDAIVESRCGESS